MALSASDLAAFTSSLATWEWIEDIATVVVILGVIGEYVADFTKFAERRKIEKSLGKLSCLVLIAGLAVEWLGMVRTSQLSEVLLEDSREATEVLRIHADELEIQLQSQGLHADELDAQIQLDQQKRADRRLNDKDKKTLKSRLSGFKVSKLLFGSSERNLEQIRLAQDLKEALVATQWASDPSNVVCCSSMPQMGEPNSLPTGVLTIYSSSDEDGKTAAAALINALNSLKKINVSAAPPKDPSRYNLPKDMQGVVAIAIGPKF